MSFRMPRQAYAQMLSPGSPIDTGAVAVGVADTRLDAAQRWAEQVGCPATDEGGSDRGGPPTGHDLNTFDTQVG